MAARRSINGARPPALAQIGRTGIYALDVPDALPVENFPRWWRAWSRCADYEWRFRSIDRSAGDAASRCGACHWDYLFEEHGGVGRRKSSPRVLRKAGVAERRQQSSSIHGDFG